MGPDRAARSSRSSGLHRRRVAKVELTKGAVCPNAQ